MTVSEQPMVGIDTREYPPIVFGRCGTCGQRALIQRGLCSDCSEIREWSRINRAFCAIIHRSRFTSLRRDSPLNETTD